MGTEQATAKILPFVTKTERVRRKRAGRPKRATTYGVARRRLQRAIDEAAIRAHGSVLASTFQSVRDNGLGKMRMDTVAKDVRAAMRCAFRDFELGEVAP